MCDILKENVSIVKDILCANTVPLAPVMRTGQCSLLRGSRAGEIVGMVLATQCDGDTVFVDAVVDA